MQFSTVHMISILLLTTCCACKDQAVVSESRADDTLLVKIEDKSLYLSDIQELIPESSNASDSNQIIRSFSENWAKETAVLLVAEKSLPNDFNLERLVRNYRESLLTNNFEKTFIENNLDTTVTESQSQAFYKEHSQNFICNEPLLKFWFAKVPAASKGLDKFFEKWKRKDVAFVENYCLKNATIFDLSDSDWKALSNAKQFFPEKLIKKINFTKKTNYQYNHDGFEYFLLVTDVIKEGESEPLNYMQDKLVKLILHQRKSEMLESLREELYQDALEKNQIVFYNNK